MGNNASSAICSLRPPVRFRSSRVIRISAQRSATRTRARLRSTRPSVCWTPPPRIVEESRRRRERESEPLGLVEENGGGAAIRTRPSGACGRKRGRPPSRCALWWTTFAVFEMSSLACQPKLAQKSGERRLEAPGFAPGSENTSSQDSTMRIRLCGVAPDVKRRKNRQAPTPKTSHR
jgi:hypothetical protein